MRSPAETLLAWCPTCQAAVTQIQLGDIAAELADVVWQSEACVVRKVHVAAPCLHADETERQDTCFVERCVRMVIKDAAWCVSFSSFLHSSVTITENFQN